MILPRAKRETATGRYLSFPRRLTLHLPDEYARRALTALSAFLPGCSAALASDALIRVRIDPSFLSCPESYCLRIEEDGIFVSCGEYAGLCHALAALSSCAVADGDMLKLPETCIEDWPSAAHRGAMLELVDCQKSFESLCGDLVLLAKARMNRVHLYLSDRAGCAVQLACLPPELCTENAYTVEQMRTLCDLADALALTVIPEFDMPGHAQDLLAHFPAFRCDAEPDSGMVVTSLCTGEPSLYPFLEQVILELLSIFPGPYFHMGGDEIEMLDLHVQCLWDRCPKCLRLRREHGLADRQEQYYWFVRRIHDIVKKAGRTLIMWSDQLDCPRGAQLPKDILMHFWRVAFPSRGPYEGCSMNAQAALGYTLINSWYPETYAFTGEDIIMTSDTIRRWRWNESPACDEALRSRILGSELCVWGYPSRSLWGYMDRFFPSAVFLMGDKLWNNDELPYSPTYSRLLTRCVLGAGVPEDFDVFPAVGDVLPPPNPDIPSWPDRSPCNRAELEAVISTLSRSDLFAPCDAARAREYLACARYTLRHKFSPGD